MSIKYIEQLCSSVKGILGTFLHVENVEMVRADEPDKFRINISFKSIKQNEARVQLLLPQALLECTQERTVDLICRAVVDNIVTNTIMEIGV